MKNIKGPAIFLAQFMGDKAPFNSLKSICKWAASLGYVGVQIPTWDPRCIDLKKAAELYGQVCVEGVKLACERKTWVESEERRELSRSARAR